VGGFSYDGIITGLFLFVLVLQVFFGGIINHIAGVKVRSLTNKKNGS
jgi:hypothetical protein